MKRLVMVMVIAGILMTVSAQQEGREKQINMNHIESLRQALQSDNDGLRKSAVYFAGLYKIEDLTFELQKILNNDECEQIRLLAAYSLYHLDNKVSLNGILYASKENSNLKLRRICRALYKEIVSHRISL